MNYIGKNFIKNNNLNIAIINRGDAAMRLIRAVKELNFETNSEHKTIALYTNIDKNAMFVKEASINYCLGDSQSMCDESKMLKNTYLNYKILKKAIINTNANAVWVGWGFVSEHPEFVKICEQLNIIFIGPKSEVMAKLGDKIESKKLAENSNFPVVKWSQGEVKTIEEAKYWAEQISYPLMIKATSGGGGRGIRRVNTEKDLEYLFTSAKDEALKSFGNSAVFFEKALTNARHLEVQILADDDTVWAVGIRDCSIQRKNQKIIEEGPSPILNKEEEQKLKQAAIRLAKNAHYTNAGTIECLYDNENKQFYFMEMNTRLQVEHPVTEYTSGIDIVKWQIKISLGEKLPYSESPSNKGHAIEVRLNAEDPDNQFMPQPGIVKIFKIIGSNGVRIDTGLSEGDEISLYYDSMIAKIIAYAETREEAIAKLKRVLSESIILLGSGMGNKHFLLHLLNRTEFLDATADITWLDKYYNNYAENKIIKYANIAIFTAAIDLMIKDFNLEKKAFYSSIWRGRALIEDKTKYEIELKHGNISYKFFIQKQKNNCYLVKYNNNFYKIERSLWNKYEGWIKIGNITYKTLSDYQDMSILVEVNNELYKFSSDNAGVIRAPTSAVVLGVLVKQGDFISTKTKIISLEAMKMETAILSPCDGIVKEILVKPNMQVNINAPLMILEEKNETKESLNNYRIVFDNLEQNLNNNINNALEYLLGYDVDITSDKIEEELTNSLFNNDDNNILKVLNILIIIKNYVSKSTSGEIARKSEELLLEYLKNLLSEGKLLSEEFKQQLIQLLKFYDIDSLKYNEYLEEIMFFVHKALTRIKKFIEIFNDTIWKIIEKNINCRVCKLSLTKLTIIDDLIKNSYENYLELNEVLRHLKYRLYEQSLIIKDEIQIKSPLILIKHYYREIIFDFIRIEELNYNNQYYEISIAKYLISRQQTLEKTNFDKSIGVIGIITTFNNILDILNIAELFTKNCEYLIEQVKSNNLLLDIGIELNNSDNFIEDELLFNINNKLNNTLIFKRICFIISNKNNMYYYTFIKQNNIFEENILLRGIHPMEAKRFELWRLNNFAIKREFSNSTKVFLYSLIANENNKDIRLFAFAEIKEITANYLVSNYVSYSEFERMFIEAASAIKMQLQRILPRKIYYANRIILHIIKPLHTQHKDLVILIKNLRYYAINLNLDKIIIKAKIFDKITENFEDTVIDISIIPPDENIKVNIVKPSGGIIQTITKYEQKLLKIRSKDEIFYAYDLITLLISVKKGEFIEYDLNDNSTNLIPITREFGQNKANIVVGIINNFTNKYPEGMTRLLIAGDATCDMGSLSEAECIRIILALKMAKNMNIPVEWYPISSGAKIAKDSGTENLDWTAKTLKHIIEFCEQGYIINIIVAGINVGAQAYWNAEATMLMYAKGILIMTTKASMLLTGKRALDFSGGISAEDNQGIGGYDRIMGPNGQAQYFAKNLKEAINILFNYYEFSYVMSTEKYPRQFVTNDLMERTISVFPHTSHGFNCVGDIFFKEKNIDRKKTFDMRTVMRSVTDQDIKPLERWHSFKNAETAIVWDASIGGYSVCFLGVESQSINRLGVLPADGPDSWMGGTLYPNSSKKLARAINSASNYRPIVIFANLSGFDGSPESLRLLQLEYGAELGRAVVHCQSHILFCVLTRFHGGAYVVFSQMLNEKLKIVAINGAFASVIGGTPAAAVVFPGEVKSLINADERIIVAQKNIQLASEKDKLKLQKQYKEIYQHIYLEKQTQIAEEFDKIHSVERAVKVGSVSDVVDFENLRKYLIQELEKIYKEIKINYEISN